MWNKMENTPYRRIFLVNKIQVRVYIVVNIICSYVIRLCSSVPRSDVKLSTAE